MKKSKNKTLILFTESFPFGNTTENVFLQNEIRHLCNIFQKVIIVPKAISGYQSVNANFHIELSLSRILIKKNKIKYLLAALKNRYLYKEIFLHNIFICNINKLKRLIYFVAKAEIIKKWANEYFLDYFLEENKVLFYPFWNDEIILSIENLVKNTSNIKLITKAHGHDLYAERHENYIPCYQYNLELIDKIYLTSQASFDYLSNKYPKYKNKMKVFYTGVNQSIKISIPSRDNVIRIVSCSNIIDIKRVDLIIKGIQKYISKYHQAVHWVHFGDGDMKNKIEEHALNIDTNNFTFDMKGFLLNKEVLEYYKNNPIDIFITTTSTEGGVPVSMQEAQAHGIPIIGPDVGGVSEIVNEKVGVLLSENPTEEEIADAIYYILSDRERFKQMRMNSVKNWEENFNEQKNYEKLSSELINLLNN